jgi:diguanylate cyclase (GGDEF)-like protein
MNEQYKLLLIDDEAQFRFMTKMGLESNGFTVLEAADGNEGLKILAKEKPDLVLLDLNMPEPDGHKVCDLIKGDESLKHIPVIILTTSDDLSDKLNRLEGGADDYITKSADPKERAARIRTVIRRNLQNLDSNPLTHLPGNNKIQEIITKKMQSGEQFAVAYTDLDNFKAYNDKYGFKRGDDVILFTAEIITKAVKTCGTSTDFVGHIGGDDFVVVSTPDLIQKIGNEIIRLLDSGIRRYYNKVDREQGFIVTKDRLGVAQKFPLISISIAVVNNLRYTFTNIGEIVKIVTELKKFAKQKEGSFLAIDKRG